MPKIKEIILALAIIVVLNLFFNYGVYTFYKPPQFDAFCSEEVIQKKFADKTACKAVGGKWFENTSIIPVSEGGYATPIPPQSLKESEGWCDATAECRQKYDEVREFYDRNVFIILLVAGLAALALGLFAISVAPVANGFLGGGLLSLIVGTIRYWSAMDDYLRFIILGVALILLIYFGYKKMRPSIG